MAMMRVSNGYYGFALMAFGVCAAFTGKAGWAFSHYALLLMTVITNPILLPKAGMAWSLSLRFGPLLIGLAMIISASRVQGNHRLPLGGMIPFLLVACISASIGWVPQISYMKLINFAVFFFGIWLGTQNIDKKVEDVIQLRAMMLAVCVFFILGSFLLYWVPSVSYLSSLKAFNKGGVAEAAYSAEMMRESMITSANAYNSLFCGITSQSQTLAPVLALCFSWVTCDMLFIEKRVRWPHLGLMIISVPLMYFTRSRVAFVALVAALGIIYMYTIRKVNIPFHVRQTVRQGAFLFGFLILVLTVIVEIRGNTISQWMRKSNDTEEDDRSLTEAMTSSRMGLIEECMFEFNRSPVFGSGFQVSYDHLTLMQHSNGLILSAPIEKGLLPVMVLGETGLVGAACFLFFLLSFYVTAVKRQLFITITLFGVFFTANLGEATFFSPGGMGGTLWMISAIGGFVLDTILKYERG